MSKFLFLFTIGPVQTFIAQARKTNDLYTGSSLLSGLIEYAIEQLEQLPQNKELIFPHKELKSKPNEFMAFIDCVDPRETGDTLKHKIQNKFKIIAGTVINNKDISKKPAGFDNQIEDFPDVYWMAIPFNDGDNYPEKYKQLTQLMGAVKNTRVFNQLAEAGRKCSLCGERNALFYKPNINKNGEKKKPKYLDENAIVIDDIRIVPGEGLCGICFVKRFYLKDNKQINEEEFPSTAKIALSYTLDYLFRDIESQMLFCEYKKLLGNDFDAELYYEESLTQKYFDKYDFDATNLNEIKAINKQLLNRISKINETEKLSLRLSSYYAIIAFDGDDMGKRLSGDGLKEGVSLQDFHQQLSEKLGKFSKVASDYLDSGGRGKRVYAGGDDFLGFVNLRHLFEVMGKLRTSFDKEVNIPLKENFLNDDINLTFSAGIVVAHYKTPLKEVLNRVREMMDIAKSTNNEKDAFCIATLKRSGEIEQAVCKWDLNGQKSIEIMNGIINALEDEIFSNTFIKRLAMEMYSLLDKEGSFHTGSGLENDILKAEIKRLVSRPCRLEKKPNNPKLAEDIYKLYQENWLFVGNSLKIRNFISLLSILDFIERKR